MDEDWQRGAEYFRKLIVLAALSGIVWALLLACSAHARDNGQWADQPEHIRRWFNSLKQPDNPQVSCCGEADAVAADQWRVLPSGDIEAVVTDGRGYLPDGTVIIVPKHKVSYEPNPTGHAILFIGAQGSVFCFVIGTGI
jgi:hypothetical protein